MLPKATEMLMLKLYQNLSEKDKRHYAAIEAYKLGHGAVSYLAELFGCSRQTIHEGLSELKKRVSACWSY